MRQVPRDLCVHLFVGPANARARASAIPVDLKSGSRFLATAYEPADWIALLLKSRDTGLVAQRVESLRWALSPQCQSWLVEMNARRFNVYVSVNAIAAGRRARTRDAIACNPARVPRSRP